MHIPQNSHFVHNSGNWLVSLFTIGRWAKLHLLKTGPLVPKLKCLISLGQVSRNHHFGIGQLEPHFRWKLISLKWFNDRYSLWCNAMFVSACDVQVNVWWKFVMTVKVWRCWPGCVPSRTASRERLGSIPEVSETPDPSSGTGPGSVSASGLE